MNGWSTTTPANYIGDGLWTVSFRPPTYLTYNWFVNGSLENFDYEEESCDEILNLSFIYFPRIWTPGDENTIDTFGSCVDAGSGSNYQASNEVTFNESFGGAEIIENGTTFIFPTGAESWAGFASMNSDMYPLQFSEAGSISFMGSVADGGSSGVSIEYDTPDIESSCDTETVLFLVPTPL